MAKKQAKKQNQKSKAKPAAKSAAGKATPAKRQSRRTTASKPANGKEKKKVHPLVGKVGWCDGKTLGLSTGHFVFIRRVYGDKCSVNTFTSIERKNGKYNISKIDKVKEGTVYPIPKKDTTLPRFGGVHKDVITQVPIAEIKDVGRYTLKQRHHHYIQKHMNK